MKVTLTKLKSSHQNLRTNVITGHTNMLPTKGFPFVLYGEPLTEEGDGRVVVTTPVTEVIQERDDYLEFTTANSTYGLDYVANGGKL